MSSISGNTEGGGSYEITININAATCFSKYETNIVGQPQARRYPDLLKIQKPLLPSEKVSLCQMGIWSRNIPRK